MIQKLEFSFYFPSEKTDHEAKLARHLIIHIIQSLTDIIDENIKRNEKDI